jgi:D-beta-D-heptose 7-phosphate kinase/D-beta-D-heptose 1-phosphate adenosyltransferase
MRRIEGQGSPFPASYTRRGRWPTAHPTLEFAAMSTHKIFDDPERLLPLLEEARRRDQTVVFANGCFELLHVGHIRYLGAARALGDLLIVAVNTDQSLRMIKPDRRPVNSDRERMEIIAALEAVDFVVPLSDRTPASLLALLRPHVHTKGTDYTLDRIPERVIVEAYGGRVELVGGAKERSTTEMLRSIRTPAEREHAAMALPVA